MRNSILSYIIFFLGLFFLIKLYYNSDFIHLKCIVSTVDGETYCVRKKNDLTKVANLLARVTQKLKRLVQHLENEHPDDERVKRLKIGFNPQKVYETLPTSKYTAYSENKGEKLAFCVQKEKTSDDLIDEHTLTFVALHELSHIASKTIGHTDEFWSNFKWILEKAKSYDIHNPIDYANEPTRYCGMDLNDNPYYK